MDEAFLPKMIEQCRDDKERGLVYILYYTGMHGSCLREISLESLVREGPKTYLNWKRTKTKKTMQVLIPKDKLDPVKAFLESKKQSLQWYNVLLKRMASRAGYDRVSTMTFRHTRCIREIREGTPVFLVHHKMGCTLDVVARNYTKMED